MYDNGNADWISRQREYWGSVAQDYDQLYNSRWCQLEDAQTVEFLDQTLPKGAVRVLDLGCGTGLGYRLSKMARPSLDYVGLDLSTTMLEQARRAAPGLLFEEGTMTDLSRFESSSFDGVIAIYTALSYSEDLEATLNEVSRVLRKGGGVFLSMLNRWSFRRLLRLRFGKRERYRTRHSPRTKLWVPANLASWHDLTRRVRSMGFRNFSLLGRSLCAGTFEYPRLWSFDTKCSALLPWVCNTLVIRGKKS